LHYIGIDLGGTGIKVGIVDEHYNIVGRGEAPTNMPRPVSDIMDDIAALCVDTAEKLGISMDDIGAIGIGSPGSINTSTGILEFSGNLNAHNFPMEKELTARLGKRVIIENDANAAAYGEAIAGAAKGARNAICITLGTGVGSGIIIDGKIFSGTNYAGAEFGHTVIVFGGVNDYIHGDAPFGEPGDTTPATYCGGVYYLMNFLRETYGDKPVIFITPARCFLRREVDDRFPSVHAAKRVPGKPLKAYVDVILETAVQFDIKVLDLYNDLGVDPHIPEHFEKYTMDGLHFNDEGHALIAQKLKELIESM